MDTTDNTSPLWTIRLARMEDIPALEVLIPESVRGLQAGHYSRDQMEAAIGPVFGVDQQLIEDGTYFVAEAGGTVVGCGGWSRRKSVCGSSAWRTGRDPELDPKVDAPRIRAFFVHPKWARKGIGRGILRRCEEALLAAGFRRAEIAATLTGEPLYVSAGYTVTGHFEIELRDGGRLPCVRLAKSFPAER